ncbi:MAG: hypothetical protein AAF740_08960 [Bacteroidota bacterium]
MTNTGLYARVPSEFDEIYKSVEAESAIKTALFKSVSMCFIREYGSKQQNKQLDEFLATAKGSVFKAEAELCFLPKMYNDHVEKSTRPSEGSRKGLQEPNGNSNQGDCEIPVAKELRSPTEATQSQSEELAPETIS